MSGSHKTRCCSCSCWKKRVKYGRRPLPDLNYPPPPDSDEESSPCYPNYDKGIAHENSSAVASRKRKMEERESQSQSESSSHCLKVFWNMLVKCTIPNSNKKNKVETAQ